MIIIMLIHIISQVKNSRTSELNTLVICSTPLTSRVQSLEKAVEFLGIEKTNFSEKIMLMFSISITLLQAVRMHCALEVPIACVFEACRHSYDPNNG